jgi:hypothetical protein
VPKDFQVTITDPDRRKVLMELLGRDTVCVMSPLTFEAQLPGIGVKRVYLFDLDELTAEEKERLAANAAARYGLSAEESAEEMAENGMPILADGCILTMHNPCRWL